MRTWFSPHGTEWQAETYAEALEQERDALHEQYEALAAERTAAGYPIDFYWYDKAKALQEQLEAVRRAVDLLDRGIIQEPGAIASVRAALYPAISPEPGA